MDMTDLATVGAGLPPAPTRLERMREVSVDLEVTFLAEMLRLAGVGRPPETGGGGAGEDAFAGFVADAHARALAEAGGLGLADHIFAALIAREGEDPAA